MAQSFERDPSNRPATVGMVIYLILVPPIIWSVYHTVAYMITETACRGKIWTGSTTVMPMVTAIVLALTLIAVFGVFFVGYRAWQRARASGEAGTNGENGERFLGMVGSTFSIILAMVILADGASILVLGACG